MGCWNIQIFCDDTALDALDELMDSAAPETDIACFLDEALAADGELDYDVCEYALVAAALVDACLHGTDWPLLSDMAMEDDGETVRFLKAQEEKREKYQPLREKAARAVSLVLGGNSELRELWEENEALYPRWTENLQKLHTRLENGGKTER